MPSIKRFRNIETKKTLLKNLKTNFFKDLYILDQDKLKVRWLKMVNLMEFKEMRSLKEYKTLKSKRLFGVNIFFFK